MVESKFSIDMFSNNIHVLTNSLREYRNRPVNILEIGSFEGRSTVWFLQHLHPKSRITCIDTFEGNTENFYRNVRDVRDALPELQERFMYNTQNFRDRVNAIRGDSHEMLFTLRYEKFDIIYVDGSHRAWDALSDIVMSFNLLKIGGIMLIDDYGGGDGIDMLASTPRSAVDAFAEIYQRLIKVVHVGYQYHFIKTADKWSG